MTAPAPSKIETGKRSASLDEGFCHGAGTDAPCADAHVPSASFDSDPDALQVGNPAPPSFVVGVAHIIPGHWLLAADFAYL